VIRVGRAVPAGLSLVLVALCGVIGLEIADQPRSPDPGLPARVAGPIRLGAADIAEPASRRDGWFREIVSRPLFNPDRRPIGPDAREVRGLPRLTGIVVDGSRRIAIFAAPSGGHPIVVEADSRIGAYDVREIDDAGVTVVGPEGTTVLRPIFDANVATPGKPPLAVRPEPPKPAGR
jgi:hypothetical protein